MKYTLTHTNPKKFTVERIDFNVIPDQEDMLFWLNGTLSGNNFVDKISGKLFPITNKDFTSTNGFPYKSKATFSAPAGDTVLIAGDVNNFFYASGTHTPNQIPVTSLFQDVDYANKLFTRHISRVVSSAGVETRAPRVADIVLYKTVRTYTKHVKCQMYFDVPTEDSTATWIDPVSGTDLVAFGSGTKTSPYKTISFVSTLTLASGSKIYIKTGDESFTGQLLSNDDYDWTCIGRTEITSTGATFIIRCSNSNITLRNFIVNAIAQEIPFSFETAGSLTTIERCYIKTKTNGTTGIRQLIASMTVTDCVFTGTAQNMVQCSATGQTIDIIGCYYKEGTRLAGVTVGGMTISVEHCALTVLIVTTIRYSNNYNIIDNYIIGKVNDYADGAYTGTVIIKWNTLIAASDSSFIDMSSINPITAEFIWDIQYNIATYGTYYGSLCTFVDQPTITCKYNHVDSLGSHGSCAIAFIDANGRACPNIDVSNNSLINDCPSPGVAGDLLSVISVGNQTPLLGDELCNGAVIERNRIWLAGAYGNTVGDSHGIAVFKTDNCRVAYNYIEGSAIGIVFKRPITADESSCLYNVVVNCQNGILIKGYSGCVIYGNTVYADNEHLIHLGVGVDVYANEEGGASENNILRNNISYHNSIDTNYPVIEIDSTSLNTICNNNLLYNSNGKFQVDLASKTFAQWQALGYDTNSLFQMMVFNSIANNHFWLVTPIYIGANVGVAYDEGLDITTDFGTGTEVPTVVTKQQGVNWNVGAYIN